MLFVIVQSYSILNKNFIFTKKTNKEINYLKDA